MSLDYLNWKIEHKSVLETFPDKKVFSFFGDYFMGHFIWIF